MNVFRSVLGLVAVLCLVGGCATSGASRASLVGACDGGDARACGEMGDRFRLGRDGGERNVARALSYYRRACDGGDAEGCRERAYAYLKGYGSAVDYARAAVFYEKACELGDGMGCMNVGILCMYDEPEKRDYACGVKQWERACEVEHSGACGITGYWYYKGLFVGIREQGVCFARSACDEQADKGCASMNFHYYAPPKDMVRALSYLEQACEGGHIESCIDLGNIYREGLEVEMDEMRAAELYKKACDGGEPDGCKALAGME